MTKVKLDYSADQIDAFDDNDAVDMDDLIANNTQWLDGLESSPTEGQLTERLGWLAEEAANDLVVERFITDINNRWYSTERAKDRDQRASTIRKAFRREVRDIETLSRQQGVKDGRVYTDTNYTPTPQERAATYAALKPKVISLAIAQDLMERAIRQVQQIGVTGEERLIKLILLTATSRVLPKPVNPLVHGPSSSGKSHVTNCTLKLFPEDEVIHLTTGSALSLVYDDLSFVHKVVFLAEASPIQQDGDGTFALIVRSLISEGKLIHKTTVKDEDSPTGFRTETIEKNGPISMIVTTTANAIHAENETRMLRYGATESTDHTKAVMRLLGTQAVNGHSADDIDLDEWHELQRWIAAGPRHVVIPFAESLADHIPPAAVRFRRDFSSLIGLISAHALFYQAQREKTENGSVIATVDDYAAVRDIVSHVMEESIGKRPSERVKQIVAYVDGHISLAKKNLSGQVVKPKSKPRRASNQRVRPESDGEVLTISVRALGEALGIDRNAAERGVRDALDAGFLVNKETRPRQPMQLIVGDRKLDDVGSCTLLPAPEIL